MQLFFWFALILYIMLKYIPIRSFPNSGNIIAICLKLTTPQISFQIRLLLKETLLIEKYNDYWRHFLRDD